MDDDEPTETPSSATVRHVVEEVTVGGTGAVLALIVGGPVGAIVGGAGGALFSRALASVRRGEADRAGRTVERASRIAELTVDELAAWIEADPRHAGLLVAVVEAAARSTAEAHLDALARVLADGASDDARLDEDTLAARALGTMGPAHVQVLSVLAAGDAQAVEGGLTSAYTLAHVAKRRPHLAASVDALVAGLVSTGSVRSDTSTYDRASATAYYTVTPFGSRCLAFLDERAPSTDY